MSSVYPHTGKEVYDVEIREQELILCANGCGSPKIKRIDMLVTNNGLVCCSECAHELDKWGAWFVDMTRRATKIRAGMANKKGE